MHASVVIPCLNERRNVGATAHSLGFGLGADIAPPDTTLIVVDNRSTDRTRGVLEEIQRRSCAGSVVIVSEAERGYVPPRHRGVLAAEELAHCREILPEQMLILQCDADTIYENGYVTAMRKAAEAAGRNILVEGTTRPPSSFDDCHHGFQQLADDLDARLEPVCVRDGLDVIVDDKVSGFSLATYFEWGGHRREYNSENAEYHAETARLFIRGLIQGGAKVRATDAVAQPSRRKVIRNPVRHFATAGFPREDAWWRRWSARYAGPRDIIDFENPAALSALAPALATRRAHVIVLFAALPIMIDRALHPLAATERAHPLVEAFIDEMPSLSAHIAAGELSPVFEASFEMLDRWIDRFAAVEP